MDPRYVIRSQDNVVEAWSPVRLPFEPQGGLLEFRAALRTALLGLKAEPDRRLHATYGAADTGQFVDTENVLLYNVGSRALRHLMRHGVTFERSFHHPPPPESSGLAPTGLHYHRYQSRVDPVPQHWVKGELLASFSDVAVASLTAAKVWFAIRQQAAPPRAPNREPRRFLMEVSVQSQGGPAGVSVEQVKALLDGAISAYHSCVGAPLEAIQRFSAKLGHPADFELMLPDPAWAALGPRRLVNALGQLNPGDDLCMAATATPEAKSPSGTTSWTLFGKLFAAEPEFRSWWAFGRV